MSIQNYPLSLKAYPNAVLNTLGVFKEGNEDIKSNATRVGATSSAIQTYCSAVLKQPEISFDELDNETKKKMPNINEHLQAARGHAQTFNNEINPNMWRTITDISGYSNDFDAFYTSIKSALKKWEDGDLQGKEEVKLYLNALHEDILSRTKKAQNVAEQIHQFSSDLSADISNYNTDLNKIHSILDGDDGVLKTIQDQLGEINKQIIGGSIGTAISSLAIIGGIALTIVGAVATLPSAGLSTGLVIGGAALIVGGAAGLAFSLSALIPAVQKQHDLLFVQSTLNNDVKVLTAISTQLDSLSHTAELCAQEVQSLANSWDFIAGHLNQVIGSIESAQHFEEVRLLVGPFVEATKSNWEDAKEAVKQVEDTFSSIRIEEVEKLDEETIKKLLKETA